MAAMHDPESWTEFQRRREEWRSKREARRAEWRARREAHRAQWREHWRDMGHWSGMNAAGWGIGGPSEDVSALKAKVSEMEKTIAQLSERIIVLEKLAVGSDDARLAAEIDKLRSKDE
jgi:hypothetical protein